MNVESARDVVGAEAISGFRLSPTQWDIWRRQAGSRVLLSRARVVVRGPLDPAWIADRLDEVLSRNDILRATLRQLPGMQAPLQIIGDDVRARLDTHDWRSCAVAERDARLGALWRQDPELDWRDAPLVSAAVAQIADAEHVVQLTAPSIIADAESLGLILRDIAARADGAPAADRAEVQFLHLSEWCHEVREAPEGAVHRRFWSEQFADAPPPLALPFAETGSRGPAGQVQARAAHAGRAEALAAWALVLGRYACAADLAIGCRVAGRLFDELANAVGPMATFLPLRLRWNGDETFAAFAEQVDRLIAQAVDHLPYLDGDGSGADALRVGFEYREAETIGGGGPLSFDGLEIEGELRDFDLLLRCVADPDGLELTVVYDQGRHGAAVTQSIADALQTTLAETTGETPVGRAATIGKREFDLVVRGWNQTAELPVDEACLHDVFARIARERPDAPAVISAERRLNFAELDLRSTQLAHRLIARGVCPGARVAIVLKRSADLIVAVLGTWKAGAAYVPLDPDNPPKRNLALIEQAGVAVIVTSPESRANLPERAEPVLELADDLLAGAPAQAPAVDVSPRDAAYVIFTSGSTGTPKGVVVGASFAVNLARALQQRIYHGRGELTVSVNAPLSFDASVKQIVQLLNGHCLCVVPEDARQDGERLLAFIRDHRIDVLDCTPSHIKLLIGAGFGDWNEAHPSVVLVGGETVDAATWSLLARHRAAVFNVYGPTEATVNATVERVSADAAPSIGRPLANMRVYILDGELRPLPVGVPGELCIGGAGVARGYLDKPEDTAQRFVADPFAAEDGARLYRTGDGARFLADGRIAFLGRLDDQVKVRGFRVEPEEIAEVLRRHPAIDDAVVIARGDGGDRRLVGYVKCGTAGAIDADALTGLAQFNRNETEYLYDEIFRKHTYVRHGIRLPDDACVFDVGANIGMFSIYAAQRCPGADIYAFEPIPPIVDKLRGNLAKHAPGAKVFAFGLSDQAADTEFTFYPGYSMMSGQEAYSDAAGEVKTIAQYLHNAQAAGEGSAALIEHVGELLEERFRPVAVRCGLRRLSDVMREHAVARIDLLKIDVQRAELDVLRGIDDDDWRRVGQVVMELHDAAGTATQGRAGLLLDLLERKGFEVRIEQDDLLTGTDRYTLYAWRPADGAAADAAIAPDLAAAPPSASELRAFLSERLPDYMVPAAFVVMPEFPLTRHGKVDRQSLPEPGQRRDAYQRAAATRPENWQEEAMAAVWKEVLGLDEIGVEDNFFQLGGDSIRSIQVQAAAQKRGLRFPLAKLFTHQTIRALVRGTDLANAPRPSAGAPAFGLIGAEDRARLPADAEDAYPLGALQAGMIYHTELTGRAATYHNATSHCVECRLDPAALEAALNELVAAHPVLRTSFHLTGFSEALQIVHRGVSIALETADLGALAPDEQDRVIEAEIRAELQRFFDFEAAPLVRFKAYRLGPNRFQLSVAEYHGVIDGWSLHLLLAEICQRYARRLGLEIELPLDPPLLAYRRFVELERETQQAEESRGFWIRNLTGAPSVRAQPEQALERSRVRTVEGWQVELPAQAGDSLWELAARIGVPAKSVLLAIHARAIGMMHGVRDVVTGLVVNGRPEEPEGDRILGLFINTVPFRMRLDGGSWADLARRAFELESALVPHRRFPLADIQRMFGGAVFFESFFNFSQFHVLPGQTADGAVLISGSRAVPADVDFPLAVDFEVAPDLHAIKLGFQYDAQQFDRDRISHLGGCYRRAIDACLADPHAPWEETLPDDVPGPIEQRVARIWSDLIGNPNIGRHDDFLAVGGHSLLATRIVARIRRELGNDLALSTFCSRRTIASLAKAIEIDAMRATGA